MFKYNIHHSSKVIEFAKDNKVKLIYSATSVIRNNGNDENLSPTHGLNQRILS